METLFGKEPPLSTVPDWTTVHKTPQHASHMWRDDDRKQLSPRIREDFVSSRLSNRDAKRLSRVIFEAFRILPVWFTVSFAVLRLPSMSPVALECHFPLANVSEA